MSTNPPVSTAKKTRQAGLQNAFLEDFAQHGIVTKACKTAGIDRKTVYNWKEHSEDFLFRYNQALEEAKDNIRAEIYRRAHDGWDEEVYQLGNYAGTVHKYSDTLLIFHAKAIMPEYRDKSQVDVNANVHANIQQSDFADALRHLPGDQLAQVKQWLLDAKARRE